ncbi:hypothetical protein [Paucibacter sp. DJ2R-2]|uniref:hypothetical protein n=1 Tax=Paucibacter sp. DJ2R-2 TaxID=2893558 RepID=UPI0021E4CCB3|nr:hypothetical protein [Paucibacter sp. DJ2R-2]MCV2441070.1 hypothetical protein [Paucibacter sp. DJ2R-2]
MKNMTLLSYRWPALLLPLLLGTAVRAADFELVSPEQSRAEQAAVAAAGPQADTSPLPVARTRSLRPRIVVLSPKSGIGPLKSPIRFELLFEPSGEVKINPNTLKILYGFLKIDLTSKIRENAKISDTGILAEGAVIPKGDHKLLIQVADEFGRMAETELRFKVDE